MAGPSTAGCAGARRTGSKIPPVIFIGYRGFSCGFSVQVMCTRSNNFTVMVSLTFDIILIDGNCRSLYHAFINTSLTLISRREFDRMKAHNKRYTLPESEAL